MSSYASIITDERPTLPSIHTLNLPLLKRNNSQFSRHDRHVSTSSTATSASSSFSSSSPSSSRSASPESPNTPRMTHTTQFRLIPCPLENATALVITSPLPSHPNHQNQNGDQNHNGDSPATTTSNYASHGKMGRGVLIMGDKVRDIRSGRRPIARGARVHPYRLALPENRDSTSSSSRSTSYSSSSSPIHRRSSVISVSSYAP